MGQGKSQFTEEELQDYQVQTSNIPGPKSYIHIPLLNTYT
jgi:hypothetical protein